METKEKDKMQDNHQIETKKILSRMEFHIFKKFIFIVLSHYPQTQELWNKFDSLIKPTTPSEACEAVLSREIAGSSQDVTNVIDEVMNATIGHLTHFHGSLLDKTEVQKFHNVKELSRKVRCFLNIIDELTINCNSGAIVNETSSTPASTSATITCHNRVVRDRQEGPTKYITNESYNLIHLFIQHIQYCMKLYYSTSMKYYSPYFVVSQSSGYGKTRLVMECQCQYKVVYICLRATKDNHKGWPSGTQVIAPFLLNNKNTNNYMFWFNLFAVILDEVTAMTLEEYNVLDLMRNIHNQTTFWNHILQRVANGVTTYRIDVPKRDKTKVLFVFDEISYLFPSSSLSSNGGGAGQDYPTVFYQLRRGLRELDNWTITGSLALFMGIMIDTDPRIQAIPPIGQQHDPSSRLNELGNELLPPFYTFPMMLDIAQWYHNEKQIDLLHTTAANHPLKYYELTMKFSDDDNSCSRCGSHNTTLFQWNPLMQLLLSRPIFFVYALQVLDNFILPPTSIEGYCKLMIQSFELAETKLNCYNAKVATLTEVHLLALLGSRFALESTSSTLNVVAMQSGMATCYYINHSPSNSRTNVLVRYPSEPILVSVAMMKMNESEMTGVLSAGVDSWTLVVRSLSRMIMEKRIAPGEISVLLGQLVASKAMDQTLLETSSKEDLFHPVFSSVKASLSNGADVSSKRSRDDTGNTGILLAATVSGIPIRMGWWRPVTLLAYLKNLLSSTVLNNITSHIRNLFPGALVFCTHFIIRKSSDTITYKHLVEFVRRGAGIVFTNGALGGVDMAIIVIIPKSHGIAIDLYDESTFTLTLLCWRMQNTLSTISLKETTLRAVTNTLCRELLSLNLNMLLISCNVTPSKSSTSTSPMFVTGLFECEDGIDLSDPLSPIVVHVENKPAVPGSFEIRITNESKKRKASSTMVDTLTKTTVSGKAISSPFRDVASSFAFSTTDIEPTPGFKPLESKCLIVPMAGLNDDGVTVDSRFYIPCLNAVLAQTLQSMQCKAWKELLIQQCNQGKDPGQVAALLQDMCMLEVDVASMKHNM